MKKLLYTISWYFYFFTYIGANPSSLDTSFNLNGSTTNFFQSYTVNQAQAIVAQPDGKIVTAGYSGDNGILVRYQNDGTLDHTFNATGTPGYVVINIGSQTVLYGMLQQQADDKIVVVGYATINNVDNAFIARYNRDGSLDTSFNDVNSNNTGGYITNIIGDNTQLYAVALDANLNIVVAGWATYLGSANACVARYNTEGILDTTFNSTGYVTTLIGDVFTKLRTLTLQTDGSIVVAGQAEVDNEDDQPAQQIIVIRYLSDGTLDSSFNSSGSICPLQNSNYLSSAAYGITLQPDQKIIVVGATNQDTAGFDNQTYTVIRINTDGTLDETFNADDTPGYILSDSGLQATSAIVQTNGQIVTCGFNYSNNYIAVVIRYNNDGTVDPTFDFVINDVGSNTLSNAIALQADGKIIVSGTISVYYTK